MEANDVCFIFELVRIANPFFEKQINDVNIKLNGKKIKFEFTIFDNLYMIEVNLDSDEKSIAQSIYKQFNDIECKCKPNE